MNAIRRKVYTYGGIAAFGAAAFLLSLGTAESGQPGRLPSLLAFAGALLAAILAVRSGIRLKEARMIVENRILHIRPAVLQEREPGKETDFAVGSSVEMFVSCFGLLIGSKIIKFNRDGIRLKAVEIGRGYLSLDYGGNAGTRNIRLLCTETDRGDLADIIERFRYETGVLPVIAE